MSIQGIACRLAGAHALPGELVERLTSHLPDVPTTPVEALESDGDTLTRLTDEMRRALDDGDDELPDEVVMFLRDRVATRAGSTAARIPAGPDGADARPAASSTPTPAAPASPSAGPDRGSRP